MGKPSEHMTIVIVGNWNINIFNIDWVSEYIFKEAKVKMEYLLGGFDRGLRYSTESLMLSVFSEKIMITVLKDEKDSYIEIYNIIDTITDVLPHTPVQAFGVNFKFETGVEEILKDLFTLKDEEYFKKNYDSTLNINIKRSLKSENNKLNFTIKFEKEKYNFDFNYHYEIKNILNLKEIINEDMFSQLYKESIELLLECYKIKVNGNG